MSFICRRSASLLTRTVLRGLSVPKYQETRTIKRWVAPTLRVLKNRREQVGPEPLKPRSTFLEWNFDAEVYAFGKRLGEDFDKAILVQALTHRSYVIKLEDERGNVEIGQELPLSNMELICEGDGIISSYIYEDLAKRYPEDVVKALRAYLMTDEMLAHVAKHIGLTDLILTREFPVEQETLANTFRAVVAALHQSQTLERAQLFVKDFLMCHLADKDVFDIWSPENPLEYLMELLKTKGIDEIEPRLCNQSAVNTILANYQVGLYDNDKKLLGIGWGESVDIAKETAALDAIHRIHSENYQKYKQF